MRFSDTRRWLGGLRSGHAILGELTPEQEDYTRTIIGRERRDYVWIMARTPSISGAEYERLVSIVEDLGYDTTVLERVPQRW